MTPNEQALTLIDSGRGKLPFNRRNLCYNQAQGEAAICHELEVRGRRQDNKHTVDESQRLILMIKCRAVLKIIENKRGM